MRTNSVKSAARVLDLLELLAALPGGLRLSDVARRLGMPKSSASALLATLLERGYIESAPDGYRLATRFRAEGWLGGDRSRLLKVAKPVMTRLAAATGETAFLGVMTPDSNVLYVAKAISPQPLRYDVEVGVVRPAYCTSIGLVMLSDLPDDKIDQFLGQQSLQKATPHTVTDPLEIRGLIARARSDGYLSLADTLVAGTSGVGVPVRDPSGRAIAGLSVIAPSSRFTRAGEEAAVQAVIKAAAEIGAALAAYGGSEPPISQSKEGVSDG